MSKTSYSADVLVVGGGISGAVSAIAAARQGASVILIEKNSCLGGIATMGLLGELNAVSLHGQNVVPEIGEEILDRMTKAGAGYLEEAVPMSSNPEIKVDRFRYNGEYLKLVLDAMVEEAGVKIFLNSEVKDTRMMADGPEVHVATAFEEIRFCGKILIDSTGNSQCVYQLGGDTEITERDRMQAVTTVFRMGGVDMDKFLAMSVEEIQALVRKGESDGVLPARILAMLRIPGTTEIAVNCTRLPGVNHEALEEVSRSYIQLRKQVEEVIPFIIANVPGCEQAYLSNLAPMLGVRDRRKTIGDYELKGEELINCREFTDAVAVGAYPVDIHVKSDSGNAVQFHPINGNGIYKIPYGCLVPRNLEHVLVNGKAISADNTAYAAFRTMGPLMSIATAVGVAAAMIVENGWSAHRIDIEKLQSRLRDCGTIEI